MHTLENPNLVAYTLLFSRRNQNKMEKRSIPELGQKNYEMNLEHLLLIKKCSKYDGPL